VEPAVGSTPPWAGVTPAPGIKKEKKEERNRADALSLWFF